MQPDSSIKVRQRLIRLAELIRKDGAAYPLTPILLELWGEVFNRAQITDAQIDAAFDEAERRLRFWPTPAEVLGFILIAEKTSSEEKAALKWDEVRDYVRNDYHPDLKNHQGRRISEQTGRAIRAAGGLEHISECTGDDLVFARKRFIEAYLRLDELRQHEFLLPEGEVKRLLAETAKTMSVDRLLEPPGTVEPASKPAQSNGSDSE